MGDSLELAALKLQMRAALIHERYWRERAALAESLLDERGRLAVMAQDRTRERVATVATVSPPTWGGSHLRAARHRSEEPSKPLQPWTARFPRSD